MEEHLFSRFLIFDLPGAEKLSEDPTTVRIREGAKLNNSMLGFGQVVKSLALARDNLHDAEFVDFKQSVLTSLLPDILGGSTRSLIVTTIPPADYKANSFTLQFAQLFRQLRSFPIVNDGRQVLSLLALLVQNVRILTQEAHWLRRLMQAAYLGGRHSSLGHSYGAANENLSGTVFLCFTSTNVQILTQHQGRQAYICVAVGLNVWGRRAFCGGHARIV